MSPNDLTHDVSDEILCQKLAQGELGALRLIIARHGEQMHRIAAVILHANDDADDVVQDVFVKLWDIRDAALDIKSLRAYLIRSTRNRALNIRKSNSARSRAHQTYSAAQPVATSNTGDANVVASELDAILQSALASLPPRVREIFVMHRQMGLSYADIATELGISVATVHQQMSRAVRRLAEVVQGSGLHQNDKRGSVQGF